STLFSCSFQYIFTSSPKIFILFSWNPENLLLASSLAFSVVFFFVLSPMMYLLLYIQRRIRWAACPGRFPPPALFSSVQRKFSHCCGIKQAMVIILMLYLTHQFVAIFKQFNAGTDIHLRIDPSVVSL